MLLKELSRDFEFDISSILIVENKKAPIGDI